MFKFTALGLFLLYTSPLIGQDSIKIIQAELVRDYISLMEDPEGLFGCCRGFSGKNVQASSYLPSQGNSNYHPGNLQDVLLSKAWVEGAEGNGVGEYISFDYSFDAAYKDAAEGAYRYSDTWDILNGYQKSLKTWNENGRIKRFKVYLDGKVYAFLDLLNVPGVQRAELGFLKYLDKEKGSLRIKLEIVSVYPGEKYSDTALTKIIW